MDNMPGMQHSDHDSLGSNTTTGVSMAMGMTSTFSTSTRVTLFFSDWTTDTPAKYFGTLLFLFTITLFNRFLGAWRSQLGHKWANDSAQARQQVELRRRHKRSMSRAKVEHQAPDVITDGDFDETAPLSPVPPGMDIEAGHATRSSTPGWMAVFGGRWRAGNPWRFNIDFPRSLLEGLRAIIGYLLMLAVMTFNLGFFLVIILGIVVGELLLGRFISGTGWEEGGCHDG